MSLIECPACHKQVSQRAPACPGCGEPLASSVESAYGGAINTNDPVHVVGIIVCGLMILGVIAFITMVV